MKFDTITGVMEYGFVGFQTKSVLRESKFAGVPDVAGVYLVLRDPSAPPVFSEKSAGGHFKGKDPAVTLAVLQSSWVSGAAVLYIGKAGGGTSSSTLRRRLRSYLRFGEGHPVGHWGGRFIWQLQDVDTLLFCWRPARDRDARELEQELIQDFVNDYGVRPFANLRD